MEKGRKKSRNEGRKGKTERGRGKGRNEGRRKQKKEKIAKREE